MDHYVDSHRFGVTSFPCTDLVVLSLIRRPTRISGGYTTYALNVFENGRPLPRSNPSQHRSLFALALVSGASKIDPDRGYRSPGRITGQCAPNEKEDKAQYESITHGSIS